MNKEQVYDEKISPLMAQIIDVCKANNIAFVASFSIPNDDDETLACTSALLTDETEPPQNLQDAVKVLRYGRRSTSPMMLRTEHGDGSTTLTAIV